MMEKERTKKLRERYSWRINLDKNLRKPAKVLASAEGKEVRVFLSEILEKELLNPEVTNI